MKPLVKKSTVPSSSLQGITLCADIVQAPRAVGDAGQARPMARKPLRSDDRKAVFKIKDYTAYNLFERMAPHGGASVFF
jgi:hypothetical protein